MEWYLKVLRQYADFKGRARRKEYWMFTLFNILFAVGAILIDYTVGTNFLAGYGIFYMLYALATFVPGLGVTVRRLHDVGKSGWMILVGLIPLIGAIWLLVLLVQEGDRGINRFGPDPKDELNYDRIEEIGN